MKMARIGLYKYTWQKHRSLIADLAVMSFAVFLAGLSIFAVLRFTGIGESAQKTGQESVSDLRGAAPEVVTQQAVSAQTTASKLSAKISINNSAGYAYVGQEDVLLLSFALTSPGKASLKEISFSVDGYASAGDLSSLQLYYENKLAGQAPVMDAMALFDKIDITLEPGQKASFEVKSDIGGSAKSGDRVQVGIADTSAIGLSDEEGLKVLTETVNDDAGFPLWGGLTSIIGNKIKK
jgi:hypothetical protein